MYYYFSEGLLKIIATETLSPVLKDRTTGPHSGSGVHLLPSGTIWQVHIISGETKIRIGVVYASYVGST
jgi:hypothetical protein